MTKKFEPIIVDYLDLISPKEVTEEGRKQLAESQKEYSEFMTKFRKEHDVNVVINDKILTFN